MACAPPEFTEVNISHSSIIPVSNTTVNRPASTFSRLQQWFILVIATGMHLFNAYMLISSMFQLDLAIFNLVSMYSTVFSWRKLGSAVFQIFSAVRCLVEIFRKYISQPFRRNNYRPFRGSVTQSYNDIITV